MKSRLQDMRMPSATPTDAEIAAWRSLTRDEQIARMESLLTSEVCSTATTTTMDEILAIARARNEKRHRA